MASIRKKIILDKIAMLLIVIALALIGIVGLSMIYQSMHQIELICRTVNLDEKNHSLHDHLISSLNKKAIKTHRVASSVIVFGSVLLFIGALMFNRHLNDLIVRPISQIQEGIRQIENGNLKYRLKPDSCEDEFQTLATSLNNMASALQSAYDEAVSSYRQTLEALVVAIDAREHGTAEHSRRVVRYTEAIAKSMKMKEKDLEHTRLGALLHDIGKIGVPDGTLLYPGELSQNQRDRIKKHPLIGYEIVKRIPFLLPAADIILYHHEKFDGSGYPYGLESDDIPLSARIFAIADALDAITSDRPYHKAKSMSEAIDEISKSSGTHFDPKVVEIFLSKSLEFWENLKMSDVSNRAI